MATNKISYQKAYDELQTILAQIENDELDVDELTKNVKKASELIKFCKSKLFETETEIEKIIQEMDNDLEK
jgi:exodeoxyribonuclease VII small subunit